MFYKFVRKRIDLEQQKMILISLLWFLTVVFCCNANDVDTSGCQCENSESDAEWITNDLDFCHGCDRVVQRLCRLSTGTILVCHVTLDCPVSDCTGNWGPWDNNGPCNNSCGSGKQKQIRICYQSGETNNMRGTLCEGGFGKSEMSRFNDCSSARNCSKPRMRIFSTATSTIPATTAFQNSPSSRKTTTTKETLKVTTKTNAARTTATTAAKATTTIASTAIMAGEVEETTASASSSSSVTITLPLLDTAKAPIELPLVLGSLGIICIAITIVFVIIIRRRSDNNKLLSSNTSFESSNTGVNSDKQKEIHLYEEVGPALPPQRNVNTNPKKPMTSNAIYNPAIAEVEYEEAYQIPESATIRSIRNPDEVIYVEPVDALSTKEKTKICNSVDIIDKEGSYVTFDQVHKGNFV